MKMDTLRRSLILLATFILAVVLMGCAAQVPTEGSREGNNTRPARDAPDFGNQNEFYDVTINGVRCIVFEGYRKGGIDCDFPR